MEFGVVREAWLVPAVKKFKERVERSYQHQDRAELEQPLHTLIQGISALS